MLDTHGSKPTKETIVTAVLSLHFAAGFFAGLMSHIAFALIIGGDNG